MKKTLVCGAGGFIGSHLVKRLKEEGYWVRAVDLKYPEFTKTSADEFFIGDLRDVNFCQKVIDQPFDEVYQLASNIGGAGFVFVGDNDADIMHNSAMINLNVIDTSCFARVKKIFYASSACVYPKHNQEDPENPLCSENSAYPANPDSEHGWEKLFSERLYFAFQRNYNIKVYIARLHNIFGPYMPWKGGRENAPAAICRKVIEAKDGNEIEIWGDGTQTRSFLYIDECIEGIRRLINSEFSGPINIGSEELISITDLAKLIIQIANKNLKLKFIPGPVGVRGRNSDNRLIQKKLNWKPQERLKEGLQITYNWIAQQLLQYNKNG